MDATQLGKTLGTLLTLAWLLPLAGFTVEIFGGFWGSRKSKAAAYLAVACIVGAFIFSGSALLLWGSQTKWAALESHHAEGAHHDTAAHATGDHDAHPAPHADDSHGHPAEAAKPSEPAHDAAPAVKAKAEPEKTYPKYFSGTIYVLAEFRDLCSFHLANRQCYRARRPELL